MVCSFACLDQSLNLDFVASGIYLSTDAGVCMSFIEYGLNWANSKLGRRIGMVVGCEVRKDPD